MAEKVNRLRLNHWIGLALLIWCAGNLAFAALHWL